MGLLDIEKRRQFLVLKCRSSFPWVRRARPPIGPTGNHVTVDSPVDWLRLKCSDICPVKEWSLLWIWSQFQIRSLFCCVLKIMKQFKSNQIKSNLFYCPHLYIKKKIQKFCCSGWDRELNFKFWANSRYDSISTCITKNFSSLLKNYILHCHSVEGYYQKEKERKVFS